MARVDLFHHLVDLFEGETFGFGLRGERGVSLWRNVNSGYVVLTTRK